ncbi:CoA pyrophosphatase [Microbacterium sp. 2FI]|uniref:NUDIX hydrolase n=1 Tax=Microbacterium sp. 2FI TaxID=2502193 RepID=UPI0010F90759|nr:CoA pyrophosphatase [Microbacterium sp. 2FI]
MSRPPVSPGARAQLSALAAAVGEGRGGRGFEAFADLPTAANSRAAAVLILFGVLDSIPSDHDPRAQVVSRDLDVLLLERAWTLRSNPGQVAFPGGRIDPGDAGPVEAALREAQEETGLDPAGVEVLGELETVPLAFNRHVVTPVLGWWRHPSPVRVVDEGESAAVFRAPVADLLDPSNRGVTVIRRDGQEWRGPGFLVRHARGEHLVWGFTGMLLDGLFDRLGWTEWWDAERELPLVLPPD